MPANTYHRVRDEAPAPPAGCPVRAWNPLGADYLADPYPVAGELREQTPIFYTDELGYVVVTRMEDIVEVFMDPDVYASVNVQDPVYPLSAEAAEVLAVPDFDPVAVMSNLPEPDHTRIRVHTREGFSRRRLQTLEPFIVRRANELIDDHARRRCTGRVRRRAGVPTARRDGVPVHRVPRAGRRPAQALVR